MTRLQKLLGALGWIVLAAVLLQLYFVARIGVMRLVDPQSTAFQRSEIARLAVSGKIMAWKQHWVPYGAISDHLKRAVIASEDGDFLDHDGIDWAAIESARSRNAAAEVRAQALQAQAQRRQKQTQERAQRRVERLQKTGRPIDAALQALASGASAPAAVQPKLVGASTISQQLTKNLFLSGERTLFRKAQEFALTYCLEWLLGKRRILEIYLNNVEWGEGVFGAEAAAQHYFGKPAAQLGAMEAARLAVMLPRPKYFEQHRYSGYLSSRSATIAARMRDVEIP
jgi:monofunctional biosynthetic peptidoglycan transglycosylase